MVFLYKNNSSGFINNLYHKKREINMIRSMLKSIILGDKASSEKFVKSLRRKGVRVGDDVIFYSPKTTLIDVTLPNLLSIGNGVRITHGVIILTHDYSWSVLKQYEDDDIKQGAIFGAQSPVKIGNNVFIGMNAIITRGVTIGDNVIIGAGSVVTKSCEPNSVYAGNPAKRIMSIPEFYEKRKAKQFEEAKTIALEYFNTYGVKPEINIFNEHFMLFCSAEQALAIPAFKKQMETSYNCYESVAYMNSTKPMFDSFDEFLEACFESSGAE